MMRDKRFTIALNLLQNLVRAKSVTPPGDVSDSTNVVTNFLKSSGINFDIVEGKPGVKNVVAKLKGSKKSNNDTPLCLVMNGHIDTVPAGEGWEKQPFSGEFIDGEVWGRGSVDMKGGITAMLLALSEIKDEGSPFCGEIIFTAVGDEEYHSQWGTKYLLANGLNGDFAINAEPTNLEFCLGNRGLLMVDIDIYGKASHGGRPHLGDNAVEKAAKIINAINEMDFTEPSNSYFEVQNGSLSVVGIKGGSRENVIPDLCTIYLDRRLMPGDSSDKAVKDILSLIKDTVGVDADINDRKNSSIVVKPEFWHEPCWTEVEHPFIQNCIDVYDSKFGRNPEISGKAAGTDASHLVSIGKMPTLIFGPGNYNLSHTNKERIKFEQVLKAADFYKDLIKKVLHD
ncbi:MAG: M20 family metallopeptidase [Spirochaetales bacterium]|nr:M20 family metallopeptidase [Spirochaetales bacterium]